MTTTDLDLTDTLSTEDAAARLDVTPKTLYNLRAAHVIEPIYVGRTLRWPTPALDKYRDAHPGRPGRKDEGPAAS